MIPKPNIAKWRNTAPWQQEIQIEQDLIISRTLVAVFSNPFLYDNLAFRGGTALHKLHLHPAPRYSEDIDLVQTKPGPVKPIMEKLAEVITYFEESRSTQNRGHGIKVLYRFVSEYEEIRGRVKLEINCREHFHVEPWVDFPFSVENDWFSGETNIRTYDINELLGTKLRALYQRSKGRDLFDLDYARRRMKLDLEKLTHSFRRYIEHATGKQHPSQREFLVNIEEKESSATFMGDMEALLRTGVEYNPAEAFTWLKKELMPLI